jgi:hypothetical protein
MLQCYGEIWGKYWANMSELSNNIQNRNNQGKALVSNIGITVGNNAKQEYQEKNQDEKNPDRECVNRE